MPEGIADVFSTAEKVVDRYFSDFSHAPNRGTIEISGERYILVRAASLSVEFFSLVRSLYGEGREREADEFARNILFDLAHAIGKSDARNFHEKMKLDDTIERLSAGPIHFAYSGWAFVDISPESCPQPNEEYYLIYDHPSSFEAHAWIAAGRSPAFPACAMNSGYSSGWCEQSFGIPLVASEILCKARGDDACRFVMAHPSRIEQVVERYVTSQPGLASRIRDYQIPDLFARKRVEEELRRSRDELEDRVRERTAELERANALLKEEMAQRAEAERKLVQMQKLEAVGRLAGGVAHDFNNILGVILGRSSMVQSRLRCSDPLWADMEAIRGACMQGASLTRHMMAFSRRDPTIAHPLDLNEQIRSFSRGLLQLIGDDVEMIFDLYDEEACVLADDAQLEQVLLNLVVNARDAMPNGGTLTIRTRLEDLLQPGGGTEHDRHVVLTVTDTGVGMDRETQSKIFDPFFSTKPHGTGLGLSTVYGIVQQIQGSVTVSSSPGCGSTFTVRLPLSDLRPSNASRVASGRMDIVRGQARVLVVEDQRALRETIQDALIEAEYQVAAVGDPLMAIALVERGDLDVDILVTDLVMPRLGGRELAAKILSKRPGVRILYISGYDRQQHADAPNRIEHAPAGRILTKPFAIEELTKAVAEVLAEDLRPV